MKTFKWTVPEFPLTEREKRPRRRRKEGRSYRGIGLIVLGVFMIFMSKLFYSTSSGFIKGLRTYFWSSGEGVVLSSELRFHETSGAGTVRYSVMVDGDRIEAETRVFDKWSGDAEKKYEEWSGRYAEGSSATVYYNGDGETSLGRWPSVLSYHFGISGVLAFYMGLSCIYRGVRCVRENKVTNVVRGVLGG